MKEMRRVLALLLCFVMLVGYVPVGALAAEADATAPAVETQAEEVVEAVAGEAISASEAKSDSDSEAEEAVEEIVEAVVGPVISASKPAAEPEETAPAETAEEITASEEAVLTEVRSAELEAALDEALDYIEGITVNNGKNDPAAVVKNFGSHFTWDHEERENSKDYLYDWSYYNGVVFEGLEYAYEVTGKEEYKEYILKYLSALIDENGGWAVSANNKDKTAAGYVDYHGADCYKTASLLLDAYEMSGDIRYLDAAEFLYADLDAAAEKYALSKAGNNFGHTWASPSDPALWLDGLYMILPFRAEYAAYVGDTAELDLIVDRLQWVSDHMYDEDEGLFYHAADSASSNSQNFWLRSMGWYAAAMVDVMDSMAGKNLEAMKAQLEKLVDGMAQYQSSYHGMWLNVPNAKQTSDNRYETSGTALLAYAIMKAVNNGWLDESYAVMATNAFVGICEEKLEDDILADICFKGNPNTASSTFYNDEGKGVGPFIMLYAEVMEYVYGAVELEPVLTDIAVSGKEQLNQGDVYELPAVTAFFSNFTTEEIADFELVSQPDMTTPGTYTVTVSFGGKTAEYVVTVIEKLPVLVEGLEAEVQEVTEDEVVEEALGQLGIVENYVAYDISAELEEGETATVSVPVPEEWADEELTAYYIDDEGNVSDEVFTVTYVDGYATFTVSHFSTYVVGLAGQETKVELNGNEMDVENYSLVRYEPQELYVRVNRIDKAGDYLLVSAGSATTSANMLTATANGITNTSNVVVLTGSDESSDITYIKDPTASAVWTATAAGSGYHLYNTEQGRFLYRSSGSTVTTRTDESSVWQSGSDNRVYTGSRYIYFNNGSWTAPSNSSATVYIYQKQTVNLETVYDRSGLYTIEGEPVSTVVKTDGTTTAALTGTLTFEPNDSKLTSDVDDISTAATYKIWNDPDTDGVDGDPAGIISKIEGNVITFSGVYGSAVVEMTYTKTLNGVDYPMVTYIQVTAQAPYYTIEILDATGAVSDDLRYHIPENPDENESHPVSYKVTHTYYKDGVLVTEEITPAEGTITWEIENTDVAYLDYDEITGDTVVTFNSEGKTTLTVYYEYEDGKSVIDVIDLIGTMRDYVIPEDETDDFPEYPNEGAVRIDKTATAVGTFSQTGVAQVELSMAGVPFNDGSEVDVVIMVDMSGSMANNNRVPAAKEATIAAIEALVKNEDGTFNKNRVAVYTFSTDLNPNNNAFFDLDVFDENRLEAMVNAEINAWDDGGGTDYGDALSKCQSVLNAAKTDGIGNDREQYVIFVTDGAPTYNFHYYDSNGREQVYAGNGQENTSALKTMSENTELYSHQMKQAGVKVYSVGIEIASSTIGTYTTTILKKIGGLQVEDEDGNKTIVNATDSNYSNYALFPEEASELKDAFMKIVGQIKQAATNIVVDDFIAPEYSLILDVPAGVTLPDGTDVCIEVVEYELDADKNRVGTGTVIETVSVTDTDKVTLSDGKVTAIDADNFRYDAETQELIWETPKLETKEMAIRYYVYLNGSAGDDAADIEAKEYPTNVEATITYTNYKGNTCQQTFPVPQLIWNGAQVTYQFYLVNDEGKPVNRAGRVIPFNEAIYVTDPVTEKVTWKDDTSVETLDASLLAKNVLPGVYTLYDPAAYYEIHVFETEDVDASGSRHNYFIIEGGDVSNKTTTKVFNSKAGKRFENYGAYTNIANFYPTSANGVTYNADNTTVTDEIDYTNTVVNFAVMWTPYLEPDTVVIDFGLDVEVNVATNDVMDSVVVGVMNSKPTSGKDTVAMNGVGTYTTPAGAEETIVTIDGLEVGTAKLLSQESVRFSLNKGNGMQLNKPVVFYYETESTYWSYDVTNPDDKGTKHTEYMYSSVTVIPATTVYYEDEYVTLKTFENGTEKSGWDVNSVKSTAKQATDRPGVYNMMEDQADFDANNAYGFDGAYSNCSSYSMNNSAMVHVSENTYATAEFDFYGTGFDVIGMTSNKTGTLVVQAFPYNADGTLAAKATKSVAVDTYYGYDYGMYYVTYLYAYDYVTDESGKAVRTEDWRMVRAAAELLGNETVMEELPATAEIGTEVTVHEMYWMQVNSSDDDENAENGLYQVPVMKLDGLTYGKYHAVVTAAYSEWLDHTADDGYDLYLDAIRIYNPAGDTYTEGDVEGNIDATIQDAYIKDGEAWPKYFQLRNLLIAANDFNAVTAEKDTSGAIFIDQKAGTYTIEDYISYGPNNEMYLAKDQAVSFVLDLSAYGSAVKDVQIGMKSANGKNVNVAMTIIGEETKTSTASITSATDCYYSIGNHVDLDGSTIIMFQNNGDADSIASITNIKITFSEKPAETTKTAEPIVENKSSANAVLKLLNAAEEPAEPEIVLDAELEVNIRKTTVKTGSSVVVKVTTSADVEALTVNGAEITKYTQNRQTGKRSWTATVKAEEAGDLQIEVIAYSADGQELETAEKLVEVTSSKATIAQKAIDSIISRLFR